jgi:hypothetical protein
MAKTKIDKELFDRMRKLGVRKSRARKVADAVRNSPKQGPKAARKAMADLQGAAGEIQDRLNGGPAAKRRVAAKKAARTRKAKAKARSDRAKDAARSRALSRS